MDGENNRAESALGIDVLICRRIMAARVSSGLSRSQVAEELGVSVKRYSSIESGLVSVPLGVAVKIARILKCSVLEFIPRSVAVNKETATDDRISALKKEVSDLVDRAEAEDLLHAMKLYLKSSTKS